MTHYNNDIIEEIKNSNDIVDVVSSYIQLKRSGRNHFGLCPFHKEKSSSFCVSEDKQIFHCFGCGSGGNVIHFISKIENINFIETLQVLAERAGITLPSSDNFEDNKAQLLKEKVYAINKIAAEFYHLNLYKPESKQAQEYIKKRKLDNKTLKAFSIGYSGNFDDLYKELKRNDFTDEEILASSLVNKTDKGKFIDRFRKRVMFPIKDVRDRSIGFGGRVLDDSLPKYINSPENIVYSKGRNLYGLNVAKFSNSKKLIIVEGYMDAISLYQRGVTNVVASLGTALTESQGRLLKKYADQVIIGYDSDSAGQAATLRGLEVLENMGCDVRILQLEDAKDPDEFVIKYGSGRFNLLVDKAISLVEFKVKVLKKSLDLNSSKDKIKFLNEIAKILANVENSIEQEVYIENISIEYMISKESIYAQINKIKYAGNQGQKILEKSSKPIRVGLTAVHTKESISESVLKREKFLLYLLLDENYSEKIRGIIDENTFKSGKNREIATILYEEFRKGNSNDKPNKNLLDLFNEESLGYLTGILAEEVSITDIDKVIEDIINNIKKDDLESKKQIILNRLKDRNLGQSEAQALEKELSDIIIGLAKFK